MIKKLFNVIAAAFFIFAVTSCASTSVENNIATIKKYDDAMFWEINGYDSKGEPSKLYVLGTIHVGDDRLYPLPDFVEDGFSESDKIVSELSDEDWNNMLPETIALQVQSSKNEAAIYAETGKTLLDELSKDEIDFLVSVLGNIEMVYAMASFEPWVLLSALSVLPIQITKLDPGKGIDGKLVAKAASLGKNVEGLDTLETQFGVITYGDRETQLLMLHDLLKDYMEDLQGCGQELIDLYEAYLNADEDKLTHLLIDEAKEDDSEYGDDYYKALFLDRNSDWAEKFSNYINDGGTTFVFAGCGHFVGDDSVFNIMRADNILK